MATYAIGDVQGCYDPLCRLLEQINFDPSEDQLWFTGDLVNRGSHSLETLRFVRSLGTQAITVLGNHDFHLLAVYFADQPLNESDTLTSILNAPDGEELCHWLRQCPLLHQAMGYVLVHAGIYPLWDLKTAAHCAQELERSLQGPGFKEFLQGMYGNEPDYWQNNLTGLQRLRFICNSFTRMRMLNEQGQLKLECKTAPNQAPADHIPWFSFPGRLTQQEKIIFGHWAALECKVNHPNLIALDSGCVWGNTLTCINLATLERTQQQAF